MPYQAIVKWKPYEDIVALLLVHQYQLGLPGMTMTRMAPYYDFSYFSTIYLFSSKIVPV